MIVLSTAAVRLWSTLTLLIFFNIEVRPLELLELRVPAHVPLGTRAALSCRWQLGPADVLYSVKWYKDGKEFFRHVPRDSEPRRRFPLPGVDVENSDVLGSKLILSSATVKTAGRYRCEVSGEKPLFPTVSNHADMDVVVFPEHGPVISGVHSKYHSGDRIRMNCTSGHSRPATQLSWYINGDPIPSENSMTSYRSDNSLIITSLTLDFKVTEVYFRDRALKIKCIATIRPIYWKSTEETAILENITMYPDTETFSKTQKTKREDRVQTNFGKTMFFSNTLRSFPFLCLFFVKYVINM